MIRRRLGAAAAAALALLLVAPPTPASAHGAPTNPPSRSAECGTEGGSAASSAACRAARAANGDADFADWDNVRVADVHGRDRQAVPDGRLCSGGVARYRGLDLPRADWPVTTLTSGAALTFTYRGTIPHTGEFRFYVTREPYDPRTPLRWSDLEDEPFLRVTDPPLTRGAYRIPGTLPKGRTGRHLIYTVWENSSTDDTYYSCSDVVLRAPSSAASPSAAPSATPSATPSAALADASGSAGSADSIPPVVTDPPPADPGTVTTIVPTAAVPDDGTRLPVTAVLVGVAAIGAGMLGIALRTRRRRR